MKTLITKKGKEKFIAAETSETKVEFEKYGLGSGSGVSEEQTTLKDEKHKGLINSVTPSEGVIAVELNIPHDIGNFAINEIGLYDKVGDLIAVSEYTGMTSSGVEGDVHIVSILISISNTDTATIVVDPSQLMATQEDVNNAIKKHAEQENPHKVTKSQVGLGNVVDIEQATKVDFDNHKNNRDIHVTKAEKEAWNAKETPEGALEKAEKSLTDAKNYTDVEIEKIKLPEVSDFETKEGAQARVDEHANNKTNPHEVTKTQVGLSNVTNDKQATKTEFDTHAGQIASTNKLGHVKVGAGLSISSDGTLMVKAIPKPFEVYTVIIDETNSNPETALTYADDAANTQPKSDEFLEFLGAKPCLLKEGKVVGYLNPNDFSKFEDGSTADITSGNAGDVMIEFPKRGIKIERKGTNLHVSMTDEPDNPDFSYMAHTKGDEQVDHFYIGAYKGFELDGKLRSLSGKLPASDKTIGTFRSLAQANGGGYQQSQWYHLVYRQAAYILYAKNLDSQTAIGRGYVDGNSSALATGSTDKLGMVYGETTGKKPVKVFGIEDFWGNVTEWIDGLVTSDDRDILITKDNSDYNDAGNGYQQYGKCFSKSGYLDKVVGDNNNGFLPETTSGSSSTYYADNTYQDSSGGRVARVGGGWNYASVAGAFYLEVTSTPSISHPILSARLSFS